MITRRLILSTLVMILCGFTPAAKAADRTWRAGKVVSIDQTEQPIIRAPSRQRTDSTQSTGDQTTSTTTTTVSGGPTGRSVKTYWYVVSDGTKFYTTKITANMFNVTTAAKVDVGDIKFAVDSNKLYLQGTDNKEYKTEIVRTSLTPPTQPPDPGPPIIQDDRPPLEL